MARQAHKLAAIEAEHGRPLAELIEEAREAREGQLELAEKLGITSNYLAYYCDRNGIQRLGRRSRYTLTPEHHAKMIAAAVESSQHLHTLGGVTKSTKEWSLELKVPINTLRRRLKLWPEENVLSGESPHVIGEGHGGRRV